MEIIVYYNDNNYTIKNDLNSNLISNAVEHTQEYKDGIPVIRLTLHEDVFKILLEPILIFSKIKEIESESKTFNDRVESTLELYNKISYFLLRNVSEAEAILSLYIRNVYYTAIKTDMQNDIYEIFNLIGNIDSSKWSNNSLPLKYVEENLKYVDWDDFTYNKSIPIEFFSKHIDEIPLEDLFRNINIPYQFIREHLHGQKVNFFSNTSVPLEFYDKIMNKIVNSINFPKIFNRKDMNIDFIRRHKNLFTDKIWKSISKYFPLSEYFIEEFKDDIKWDEFSENNNITTEIIEKYESKINWNNLSNNKSITMYIIEKYGDRLKKTHLFRNPHITSDFIRNNLDVLTRESFARISLAQNKSLTPEMIDEFHAYLNWDELVYKKTLSVEYFYKYLVQYELWRFRGIWENPNIDEKFINDNKDTINYGYLFQNDNLSFNYLKKILKTPNNKVKRYKNDLYANDFNLEERINKVLNNMSESKESGRELQMLHALIGDSNTEQDCIVLLCLNIISAILKNQKIDSYIDFMKTLNFDKYMLLRNSAVIYDGTEKSKEYLFSQLKTFLCQIEKSSYEKELNQLCNRIVPIFEEKEIVPIMGPNFVISKSNIQHIIDMMEENDKLFINCKENKVVLTKKDGRLSLDNKFIFKREVINEYSGCEAYIESGTSNIESNKRFNEMQNKTLINIHKKYGIKKPFKEFYDQYILLYPDINPTDITTEQIEVLLKNLSE